MATIYLIQCYLKSDNSWVETSSACTSRKDAEERSDNLNKNFDRHYHQIETITLNGVVKSQMENNCYVFGINES